IAYDKKCEKRLFVSPAGGVVREIRRGLKRRLMSVVIDLLDEEEMVSFEPLNLYKATRDEIVERLLEGGIFPHIKQRPFDLLADPLSIPRDIFVKAVETAPFVPSGEMQVEGWEEDFQTGLTTLKRLTEGLVHLVYKEGSTCEAFTKAQDVDRHTVDGPHPAANPSLHIQKIHPIRKNDEVVWTIDVVGVIAIGHLINQGRYFTPRVLSIAGSGVIEGRREYIKGRAGFPVSALIDGRIPKGSIRCISGDPLTGTQVETEGFMGFYETAFSVIPENTDQEMFHFFRPGISKYTASRTYVTGHLKGYKYPFSTNQHGERRPFITSSPYDKVMPLHINTMLLVKSVMAEDFDLAESLGILEVAPEDFALPAFVDPSKIDMMDIMREGLAAYAEELLE
ncbi:Na(+)-translocating NADH-quinone reductase subunit A, partial [Chlamydiales bacterium]|nr:Na(+)-translocating NADH-quinone reductase subunit A [Chlamydiales bacterium]